MRLAILLIALLPAHHALADTGVLDVSVAPSLVKVRPTKPLPAEAKPGPVKLDAVRGECEAAHVIVKANDRSISGLTATAAPLKGPKNATLPLALYREAFLDVRTASNTEGDTGLWPDALIPAVDPLVHEPRRAFPVDVPAHQNQPIFAEICVPHDAAPGTYEGTITLAAKAARAEVPVRIEVLPLAIPATSSFPVTFGLSGRSLEMGHFGEKRGDSARLALVDRYARLALRYRVSLHTMSRLAPHVTNDLGDLDVDFHDWDREVLPFLDGRAGPDGARFSALDVRIPDDLPKEDWKTYVRAFFEHVRAKGYSGPLFTYVMDEPKPSQKKELVSRLDALAGTGALRLVTMPFDPSLAGKVDLWVPNVNCFDHKEKRGEFCAGETPRETYATREAKGEQLWWYQSCSSHGCGHGPFGDQRDAYFRGWPSYMVDVDGGAARVMGWLTFANDVGGELYFDMAAAYGRWEKSKKPRVDPWDDQFLFGGNGDGTLFYPGRPDRIGGKTDVPVASLRLALIRDGLEDAELLRQLAAKGPAEARRAHEIAKALAPKPYDFHHDPAAFAQARRAVLEALAPKTAEADVRPAARP